MFAVCEEQELLVRHVKRCFETESIYVDDEQLENISDSPGIFSFEQVFSLAEVL